MKKSRTSLLFICFLFFSSLFVSCFNNTNLTNLADTTGGKVEFYIPGTVFQRVTGTMKAENDLSDLTVQVDLVSDAGRTTKSATLSNEGTSISFEDISVGLEVYAEAKIFYGDLVVAQGTSDPITIQEGDNSITITMKYLFGGVLELGIEKRVSLSKNTQASSAEIWLNKGEFAFSLLDDDGNDILSDVDWTYKKTAEVGADGAASYEEVNQDLLLVQARLKKNHREISLVPQTAFNKIIFSGMSGQVFPEAGSYELTVLVGPKKKTYVNKEGKEELFPQFEPVSETFTIQVTNAYDIDMSYYYSVDSFGNAFGSVINKYLTGNQRKVGFSGITSIPYNGICGVIKGAINDEAPLYDFDMGELRSSLPEEDRVFGDTSGGVFDGCERISSFILPGDATSILNSAFLNCTALTSVTIPASVEKIDYDVFCGCSALSNVDIPIDGELKEIWQNSFAGTALTSFTIPKKVIAIENGAFNSGCNITLADPSGTWYYLNTQDEWESWVGGGAVTGTMFDVELFDDYIRDYHLYCIKE